MQRKRAIVAILAVGLLASSRPAYAARGVWEWLERMSGPGPFHGWAVEVPVACRLTKITKASGGRQTTGDAQWDQTWRCWSPYLYEKGRPDRVSTSDAWWKRQLYVSFYLGRYSGEASDLVYAVEPPSRDVIWWKVGGTFTWEVHDYFDIHTGIEWNRLSSDENTFKSISVPTFELMGITWRPCARCSSPWRNLGIPLRASLLARSFDAADFGAVPGTFKTSPEVQFRFGIVYDLWGHR
jgi:hypothetical protein